MAMEQDTSLPTFLSRRALHAKLKPELTSGSFSNWLARATTRWGFPEPVRFGERSVSWNEREVIDWLANRPRGGRFDGRRARRSGEAA
jgi:hypothetical protein